MKINLVTASSYPNNRVQQCQDGFCKTSAVSFSEAAITAKNSLFFNNSKSALVAFGKSKQQTNIESRAYSESDFFPEYKKVSDGFKFNATKKIYANESIDKKGHLGKFYNLDEEQITVIDRKNDVILKEIKKDFENHMDLWNKQLLDHGKIAKIDRDDFLIGNTVSYVRNIRKNLPDLDYSLDEKPREKLMEKESYLGEIFSSKENICRHNSFIMKLLLEDHKVPLGVQSGFVIFPEGTGHHSWNVYRNKEEKKYEPIDVSFDKEKCWYFNNDGKPLYTDNLSLEKQVEFDVLSMQVGDELLLGFDKDKNLVTNKSDKNADFILKLKLNKYDSLNVSNLKECDGFRYETTMDDKHSIVIVDKETNKQIFEFSFDSLMCFLKTRIFSDSNRVLKMLHKPMTDETMIDDNILKRKDLFLKVDPSLNQETFDSIPAILSFK